MGEQLTKSSTCKRKHTYYSSPSASRAKKRRNKAAGINYLRTYQCNVCNLWHVTTQKKDVTDENAEKLLGK